MVQQRFFFIFYIYILKKKHFLKAFIIFKRVKLKKKIILKWEREIEIE